MQLNKLSILKFRLLFAMMISGLVLASCKATAVDKNAPKSHELSVTETTNVTREQCLALLPDKQQVKACMVKLSVQNKAEIAVLNEKIEEGLKTNNQLSTEFQQMAREEFEKETRPQN